MTIWRLISVHKELLKSEVALNFINKGCVAIGWGAIGDLDKYDSWQAIGKAIRKAYPDLTNSNIGGPSLWHLVANVQIGDLIIIDAQKGWAKVVEVTGDYFWNDEQPNVTGSFDYYHQRPIKFRDDIDANQLLKITGTRPAPGQSAQLVLFFYGSFNQILDK